MPNKTTHTVEETTVCPECHYKIFHKDTSRAEIVCENCGLVIDENLMDYGPEWRAFDSDDRDKKIHTGAPITPLLHDKGLTTTIGWRNTDSYGKSIPNKNRSQIYRLRQWQKRIRTGSHAERNLIHALSTLNRIASTMTLPRNARENAAILYRKILGQNLVKGRSSDAIIAACVYAACRQNGIPRSLDEVEIASGIPRKELGRTYRFLAQSLRLRLNPTSPMDYISRYANQLKLGTTVQTKARELIQKAEEKEILSGRGPQGIAAAALYIAAILCGEQKTQKTIAGTVGVTEVTIRNRYMEMADILHISISP
jgi:transcription initiation factor TFIIB